MFITESIIIAISISLFIYSCTLDSSGVQLSQNHIDKSIQAVPGETELCVHVIDPTATECTVPHTILVDRTDLPDQVLRTIEINSTATPGDLFESI
jgi:hypothetical protein